MIDHSSVIKLLESLHLTGEVLGIQPLAGGMSASVTLVNVRLPDGKLVDWIVRQFSASALAQRPASIDMEYGLLEILSSKNLPVSRPVAIDQQGIFFGSPSLVLEYLHGETNFSISAIPDRGEKIAKLLAQVHNVDLHQLEKVGVPPLSTNLDDLCGIKSKITEELMNEFFIREQLERCWPPKNQNPFVLLHGDMWNGNILWQRKRISGLIDWEDAFIGDPLVDLAGSRCDLVYTFGMETVEKFTNTYLRERKINTSDLPIWDLVSVLWLVRFFNGDLHAWAAFFHDYGRTDITAASIKVAINTFAQNALGKLACMASN